MKSESGEWQSVPHGAMVESVSGAYGNWLRGSCAWKQCWSLRCTDWVCRDDLASHTNNNMWYNLIRTWTTSNDDYLPTSFDGWNWENLISNTNPKLSIAVISQNGNFHITLEVIYVDVAAIHAFIRPPSDSITCTHLISMFAPTGAPYRKRI